jgi:hypothetical protein
VRGGRRSCASIALSSSQKSDGARASRLPVASERGVVGRWALPSGVAAMQRDVK